MAAGPVVSVAGQLPREEAVARGDFAGQFVSALERMLQGLRAAGATPGDLVHVRIFVTDLAAYEVARPALAGPYRAHLEGHYPPSTLVEVSGLVGGAAVEIDALAVRPAAPASLDGLQLLPEGTEARARLRVRLTPSDARYAGGLVPGSKAMELFADLETELALLEGGDEGLCVAYDMVEFHQPLHVGDYVEATAVVVERGRSSRKVYAEIHKVLGVDADGVLQSTGSSTLAARASATIVVGRTVARLGATHQSEPAR
jgi:3-aminobutyryl-CoA ammonia-lyase